MQQHPPKSVQANNPPRLHAAGARSRLELWFSMLDKLNGYRGRHLKTSVNGTPPAARMRWQVDMLRVYLMYDLHCC